LPAQTKLYAMTVELQVFETLSLAISQSEVDHESTILVASSSLLVL